MFGPKLKIDKALLARAQAVAEKAGYASVDEFLTAIIDREVTKLEGGPGEDERVEERLRGLGYIE